jgi:putative ABC transport system permease protein
MGIDPAAEVFGIPEVNAQRDAIRYPDVILYDELSRPEFGPVAETVKGGKDFTTEVAGHAVTVKGIYPLGASFGIDASCVTSDMNFRRMFPQHEPGIISAGLVRLRPGADATAVRNAIAAALPHDVDVLTKQDYETREIRYWASATPIGYVFSFGVAMGLVVGSIIVYQILFTDIGDHLAEYATLKAMGYRNRFLVAVVLMEGMILAIGGYFPGIGLCYWLYGITESATKLPMRLSAERGALVFGLTAAMCVVSGLIAMRKLRAADPAEIF